MKLKKAIEILESFALNNTITSEMDEAVCVVLEELSKRKLPQYQQNVGLGIPYVSWIPPQTNRDIPPQTNRDIDPIW